MTTSSMSGYFIVWDYANDDFNDLLATPMIVREEVLLRLIQHKKEAWFFLPFCFHRMTTSSTRFSQNELMRALTLKLAQLDRP